MLPRQLTIVAAGTAGEDTTLASGEHARVVSGVFNTVPARLQEQALLRVHGFRFGRGDIEEQRIKPVIFLQRSYPLAVGLAGHRVAGLIQGIHIPAIARDRGYAVFAFRNVSPE